MTSPSTPALDSQIQQLKLNWQSLCDLDRASAVLKIKSTGIFNRDLARKLAKKESSLRRLLTALEAPESDRALARDGKISTNELVRRAKDAKGRRAEQQLQAHAEKGADLICAWLGSTNVIRPTCEVILNEVRGELDRQLRADELPPRHDSGVLSADEIIRRSKPPALTDDIDITAWYAGWLFRWSFYAFPNTNIQSTALDLALKRTEKTRA